MRLKEQKKLLKKNEKGWKEDGCLIMTDAWSDRKRRSIMNLCVNSKMGTVFLSSKECSGEAHTSQHIYEYVESCIQQVGPENVVQVVTDNAMNNMGAAKLLKEKRPSIFFGHHVRHIPLTLCLKVHTKKRNRLETSKLNNLVYVQFNANLMEKNKKRKDRNMEVLLANNSLSAQEWIVDYDECDVDEVDPKTVDEALATDVSQAPRESPRTRELLDEDFESESEIEEQVLEEEEYESDGVQIMKVCGED
ncbi:unnamed protein product [Lactuca virosa]|uniref:DUF659 domain-containing protein n=1 Tax=Lactuca virosa TaxID=75947 RepID=A0AAU9PN02_9ASTR|nr:unnamed protein product [Lactuca virosa]